MPKFDLKTQRRLVWPPDPGFFRMPLVRGGWPVPCRIMHELMPDPTQTSMKLRMWRAIIDEEALDPALDALTAIGVARIWHNAEIVGQADYEWRCALKNEKRVSDPDHPCLHPGRVMNPRTLKPLTPLVRTSLDRI